MNKKSSSRQLDMNFEGDSRLAAHLRDGDFFLLAECSTPPREQPFESAMAVSVAIARKIRVMTLPYLHAGFQQVKNTRA